MRYLSVIYPHILNKIKNPRGDPWKSKFFLLRGVYERGQEPSKTLLRFFKQQKIKF